MKDFLKKILTRKAICSILIGIVEVSLIVIGLSYKDKVEIRDLALGDSTNTLSGFSSVITDIKEEITEVYFIQDTATNINNNYNDATIKYSVNNIKIWLDGTKLYVASPDTIYLSSGSGLFDSWTNVEKIEFNNIDTSNVVYMSTMFIDCSSLTSLDLSNFDTRKVTSMWRMFLGCKSLTSIDLSSFNTSKVTDMGGMFSGCSGLTSLNLSNFNTSNVTGDYGMSYMFLGCKSLTSLDLSNFDTSRVTNMNSMFSGCSGLTNLNISSFNTSNVTDIYNLYGMAYMFSGCSSLTSLDLSNFDTSKITDMSSMFSGCSGLTNLNISSFNTSKVTNMSRMFYGCSGLTSLSLSNFITSNVTDMSSMFKDCSGLTSLNLSKFNTSKVTNMKGMFSDCSGLLTLNISSFNTSNVTDMGEMFKNCRSLTSIDLSNFNTNNVTAMNSMFLGCSGLTSLNLINFNTTNVGSMSSMFSGCSGLTSLNISGFITRNVKDMSFMFSGCSGLTSLNFGNNFSTIRVTNMSGMFSGCSGMTSLSLSNFDTSNVIYMNQMFSGCSGLTSLSLTNFNTSNVTGMANMFKDCSGLTSLDLSNFNTSNVTSVFGMTSMFEGCSSLTSLNLSSFNTSNVTSMANMFKGCSSLTSLNLSNFNTSNVSYIYSMFEDCSSLTSLNLSNFNTGNAIRMDSMFSGCSSLTSLNIGSFNTSNVTQMNYMFRGCSLLTSLDLSSFDTNNLKNMSKMFYDCNRLETIYVSNNFNVDNVISTNEMFYGAESLIGGNGTIYSSSYTNNQYAKIDTPDTPGYFTDINDTDIPVVRLTLNKKTVSMHVDDSLKLPLEIAPQAATNKNITWTSNDTSIATVSSDGKVVAKKIGTATITAESSNNKTVTCTVMVLADGVEEDVVTLSEKSEIYTGSAIAANTATSLSGTAITYKYYNSTDCSETELSGAPIDVGNYSVKATSAGNANYASGYICVPHTITKSDTTTSLSEINKDYNGSSQAASGATSKLSSNNSDLNDASYNYIYYAQSECTGAMSTPRNVGVYYVKARLIETSNYNSSVSDCVKYTINEATITIPTSPEDKVYTGSVINSGLTAPTGSSIVSSESTTSATNIGEYTVVFKINDTNNYKWSDNTTTNKSVTWKIVANTSEVTVTLGTSSYIYDGTEKKPTVTVKQGSTTLVKDTDYEVSYSDNTNAGSNAKVIVSFKGNYAGTDSITKTFTINKATITIPTSPEDKVYTGSVINSGLTAPTGSSIVSSESTTSATNIGEYTVVFKINDTNNYKWSDNTTTNKSVTWKIVANTSEVTVTLGTSSYIYDGTEKKPTVTVKQGSTTLVKDTDYEVSYSDNTNAGSNAKVIVSFKGNYAGTDSITKTFTINKANAVISCSNKTYNGSSQVIASCVGGTVGNAEQVNAGSYNVTCTGDSNHNDAEGKSCTISKIDDIITILEKSVTYSGNNESVNVSSQSNSDVTVTYYSNSSCTQKTAVGNATTSGGAPKNVGTYYVIATSVGNNNYNGSTSNCTEALTINKKNATLTLEKGSITLKNNTGQVGYSYDGDGEITCTSNNTAVTCSVDSGNRKIEVNSSSQQTAIITVNASNGTNYSETSQSFNVSKDEISVKDNTNMEINSSSLVVDIPYNYVLTYKDVMNNLTIQSESVVIKDASGNVVNSETVALGTGSKIELTATTYTIVINGDVNGDAKISALDYIALRNHIMDASKITNEANVNAADINNDGKISTLDYVAVRNIILGR